MIRPGLSARGDPTGRLRRRQLLRIGFLMGTLLAVSEIVGALPAFFRVIKIEGLGAKIPAGRKSEVLARFRATGDDPILVLEGRFFLIHAPGAIAAAYRKCTHLGCTVPWSKAEDQFHCPCHGSLYEKRTAIVLGGPAPRPLDLFHVADQNDALIVDTNPLNLITRSGNAWDPAHVEVPDS